MRALRGDVDRIGFGDRVVARNEAAAFEKERPAAVDEDALAHHRAGRLDHAEAIYRKLIQRTPEHAQALFLLAIAVMNLFVLASVYRAFHRVKNGGSFVEDDLDVLNVVVRMKRALLSCSNGVLARMRKNSAGNET